MRVRETESSIAKISNINGSQIGSAINSCPLQCSYSAIASSAAYAIAFLFSFPTISQACHRMHKHNWAEFGEWAFLQLLIPLMLPA